MASSSTAASQESVSVAATPRNSLPVMDLTAQASSVAEHRAQRHAAQVNEWQAAASTAMLPATLRVKVLLQEAFRHEATRLRHCRDQNLITPMQERAAKADLYESYRAIIREVELTLQFRQKQGSTHQELANLAAQAVQRFAAMYPWSDSIMCSLLTHDEAGALVSRRQATVGRCGHLLPMSLGAAQPLANAKVSAAMQGRTMTVAEANVYLEECKNARAATPPPPPPVAFADDIDAAPIACSSSGKSSPLNDTDSDGGLSDRGVGSPSMSPPPAIGTHDTRSDEFDDEDLEVEEMAAYGRQSCLVFA